ncbi:DNA helicase, Rad3 [Schinkia azotoformans MEV2011]|uniref:DNA helicase, Rad3 n=1 Tax=Schinkia azotoformans MEV2011 TaxID=1348973 RepID=A0A072NHT1_SCHAZ|nr:ATP-dependent DNA helicase [Schinkia azotoformans]KEF37061.1 DNA helicase, Rad3 [Schinkia azotoformans MEV2011]MEC1697684.1 ATP-dependent DNA helicase [Schinkia azotoformans]MEC1718575.1 ATP-dependent DNA helicase [Schinkia azotoformans]MEC1727458.1 ATP-dependent DNA helicase [Schinkia azotoformans]MEC1739355.1 ATP-dependent DNA helicase [Schinkia azotoformans]
MKSIERIPFAFSKTENFYQKLSDWIGDVFYEILPEAGFELRDEQVFMAFQLERAFKEKKVMFAEAGVGTGKTLVYLLYAICYARYTGKPAIIACADETLIEQLVKEEGDIKKLEQHLGLSIDVRLAKSPDQYLCLQKLDGALLNDSDGLYDRIHQSLPSFVFDTKGMKSFYHYGDRKDYAHLNDNEWEEVAWDPFKDCFACESRHRCGQTLSRDYYRKTTDIIVCSHDFYMEHIWTHDSRKREGQLPLLPESSSVIFDEGHLLEFAAQKALTYRLKENIMEDILTRLLENDVRKQFALLIETTIDQNAVFFEELRKSIISIEGSIRKEIIFTDKLEKEARSLKNLLANLADELVFESETYTIDHYLLHIVDEHIERAEYALHLFLNSAHGIAWVQEEHYHLTLVIMPRAVKETLKENLFSKKQPYIFSSATLSENESFHYMADSLGIEEYLSFSVDSPFDYDDQMKIYVPNNEEKLSHDEKCQLTIHQINQTGGRAIVLFNSKEDLQGFKKYLSNIKVEWPVLFEGDQEISDLVSKFQNDEKAVLCSVHLWEGLDIPGPSLKNVIIWSLPFPPNDPVFDSKRKTVEDPFRDMDIPYMLLRLRQGVGRLIRTHHDSGMVTIFMPLRDRKVVEQVLGVLPTNVEYI